MSELHKMYLAIAFAALLFGYLSAREYISVALTIYAISAVQRGWARIQRDLKTAKAQAEARL